MIIQPETVWHATTDREIILFVRRGHVVNVQNSVSWTIVERHLMTEKKLTPIVVTHGSKICPVCGKPSYSREGVHPQCAMIQADAPRAMHLAAERKAKAKK